MLLDSWTPKARMLIGALTLWAVAVVSYFLITFFPVLPYSDLNSYPTTIGTIRNLQVEEFSARRRAVYFETAIYTAAGERFFLKNTEESKANAVLRSMAKEMRVAISHTSSGRIVNLRHGNRTIYSFEEAIRDQSQRAQITNTLIILFAVAGLVLFARYLKYKYRAV